MTRFMIDIETTGTAVESDDIIQIGILEVIDDGPFYRAGRSYKRTLHTSQKGNAWVQENNQKLMGISRRTPIVSIATVRKEILAFFGCTPILIGLNATTFDIPFMLRAGYLQKGDFNYGIYEMKGAQLFAEKVLQVPLSELCKTAMDAYPEIELPFGRSHEALYDCYAQLRQLNGLVRLARRRTA